MTDMREIEWYEGEAAPEEYKTLFPRGLVPKVTTGLAPGASNEPSYQYIRVYAEAQDYRVRTELANAKPHVITEKGEVVSLAQHLEGKAFFFTQQQEFVTTYDGNHRNGMFDQRVHSVLGINPVYPSMTEAAHQFESRTDVAYDIGSVFEGLPSNSSDTLMVAGKAAREEFGMLPSKGSPYLVVHGKGNIRCLVRLLPADKRRLELQEMRESQLAVLNNLFEEDLITTYAQSWLKSRSNKFLDLVRERAGSKQAIMEKCEEYSLFMDNLGVYAAVSEHNEQKRGK